MSTADAVAREADWLNTTGDGLPSLPASADGPFGVLQAYWPGNRFAGTKTGLYVLRASIADNHPAGIRYRPQYELTLRAIWPLRLSATMIAETEQQNFDNAIELLLQRIRGFPVLGETAPLDKTHGGRFLSVAQVPQEQPVTVEFDDPELTIEAFQPGRLSARIRYYADDKEFVG